jgi:translation initiation factor 5A
MTDEITFATVKDLKPGRFVLVDGIPCRVVDIELSAPGKHGSAKARITAIGIFDKSKKTLLKPSNAEVEVPIINKRKAQVVSISGATAQLMDLETYETYELEIPEEIKGSIKPSSEVEILESMNKRIMIRILGTI